MLQCHYICGCKTRVPSNPDQESLQSGCRARVPSNPDQESLQRGCRARVPSNPGQESLQSGYRARVPSNPGQESLQRATGHEFRQIPVRNPCKGLQGASSVKSRSGIPANRVQGTS
ncbi:hypothetical protein V6N12_048871 [Hibiscus sabdariffa]|uniref:Uncharacterized protein n=1 Tax=Hibiscus sabdariffa TaxID=183260 RepID=A0ABR2EKW2_9ROSI